MEELIAQAPPKMVDYLQRLNYEVEGLKVLHTHAMRAGLSQEKVMEIKQEFLERNAEYNLAKQELWAPYAERYPRAKWHMNFATGNIYVIKEDFHDVP